MDKNLQNHLEERGCTNSQGVILGVDTAYFLLYDILGRVVGYQHYNPSGTRDHKGKPKNEELRYYTYLSDYLFQNNHKSSLWGYQHLNFNKSVIFLVEGIFDAYKVINAGYNCLATLGNEPSVLKEQLFLLRVTHTIIVIADDDSAGRQLLKYGHKGYTCKGGKDLGELSQQDASVFLNGLLDYLAVGTA